MQRAWAPQAKSASCWIDKPSEPWRALMTCRRARCDHERRRSVRYTTSHINPPRRWYRPTPIGHDDTPGPTLVWRWLPADQRPASWKVFGRANSHVVGTAAAAAVSSSSLPPPPENHPHDASQHALPCNALHHRSALGAHRRIAQPTIHTAHDMESLGLSPDDLNPHGPMDSKRALARAQSAQIMSKKFMQRDRVKQKLQVRLRGA